MYCQTCGAEINDKAVVCVKCGCSTADTSVKANSENEKNRNDKPVRAYGLVLALALLVFGIGTLVLYGISTTDIPKGFRSL